MSALELAFVLAASAAGVSVKSVTGIGYPLFAIPLLAAVVGLEDAVVAVSAPAAVANLLLVWQVRRSWAQTRDLPVLMAAGVAGSLVGVFALVSLPEPPLLLMLAAMITAYAVTNLRTGGLAVTPRTGRRWSPPAGFAAGLAQGSVGVSGPVVVAWFHAYRLPRDAFILSITSVFLLSGTAQIAALWAAGAYTTDRLAASAVALAPVLLLTPLGPGLRHRLSSAGFERAVLAVLVASALALVLRVVSSLG